MASASDSSRSVLSTFVTVRRIFRVFLGPLAATDPPPIYKRLEIGLLSPLAGSRHSLSAVQAGCIRLGRL